ncbi:MAG: hypothetical protein P9X24_13520 [Candidatus Hatepunaea meridiana]|nr:hypothetical protein [Candidatus Hatepunaea meridiana]
MRHFQFLTFLLSFILISPTNASDLHDTIKEREIRGSEEYHFGEGRGVDETSAREAADKDLISKIHVSISSEHSSRVTEVATGDASNITDIFSTAHSSYSGLYLRGLEHLSFKEDNGCRAVSFIQVDSLEASYKAQEQKILDMIDRAHTAVAELRIGDALKEYYWAFLVSHTYPYTIRIDQSKDTGCDPKGYITSEIRSIIKRITIDSKDCYREADVIMAPLQFYYQGQAVRNLRFTYYDGEGRPDGFIENGVVDPLPLYNQPTSRYAPQSLCIEYAYANEMRLDPEIKALYEIFKSKTFIADKSVRLKFPWIPGEDIAVNKTVKKEPSIRKPPEIKTKHEWSRTVRVLADAKSCKDLFRAMEDYVNLRRIRIGTGWKDVAEKGRQIFCVVYDADGVSATLYFDGRIFKDVKTGAAYTELGEAFGGKRIAWFSERKQ